MEAGSADGAAVPSRKAPGFQPRTVEEQHLGAALVGRIVEKGFFSAHPGAPTSSFPRPTVLPFPVARHRSHGPRWAPVMTTMDVDEDSAEDNDPLDYDSAASHARPVQKTEKKGLDFSRWKQLAAEKSSASTSEVRKKHQASVSYKPTEQEKTATLATSAVVEVDLIGGETSKFSSPTTGMSLPHDTTRETDPRMELNKIGKSSQGDKKCLPCHGFTAMDVDTQIFGSLAPRGGNSNISDDIDAENLARLRQMPPHEIAEAQAEIMEKMNPEIVEMLKKRGQRKRGKRRAPPADETSRGSLHEPKQIQGTSSLQQMEIAKVEDLQDSRYVETKQAEAAPSSKKTVLKPAYGEWLSSSASYNNAWQSWCERVEKVRDLRFTVDGSVVKDDSSQEPGNDGCFTQYNPENVAERDFLRTEGDPAAAGYTIKEAITLVRSIVPAQRAFALQLLASILHKCLLYLQQKDCGSNISIVNHTPRVVDWQAVWAYTLGPEPEIGLALRIALDDNHNSVVLACTKVIQCLLCCEVNESYFDISEKLCIYDKDIYMAPIFRSRPEIDSGYLPGGFWKHSAKPSNLLHFTKVGADAEEEEHTIQDDVVVAGQDVAAGLVRMGILPRICFLLEMDSAPALDESLVSILVALARHSPSCVAAIMKCPRLIETVVKRFNERHDFDAYPVKIKSTVLLRVLSQADKKNCLEFVKLGFFSKLMWHMYKEPISIDHWLKYGKEKFMLTSKLIIEQLRFWKVCVGYGHCISYFEDFFPSMCMWLGSPNFDKLIEENIFNEFASVTMEAYHVLEALSRRLPKLHSASQFEEITSSESWSWSCVAPMVEVATKWLSLKTVSFASYILNQNDCSSICILWVISAIMHMLYSIFERIAPGNAMLSDEGTTTVPWLPLFVPKVGLEIVKNGFINLLHQGITGEGGRSVESLSLVDVLCQLRSQDNLEASIASVSCLNGLVQLVGEIDKCIQSAKGLNADQQHKNSNIDARILQCGIVKCARANLMQVLTIFGKLVASEWQHLQPLDVFGRGGPAPGIGVGWGCSGGGFWSKNYLLLQVDSHLIMNLLRIFPIVPGTDFSFKSTMPIIDASLGEMAFSLQRVNAVLSICIVSGPRDRSVLEKALDILLQISVLEFLAFCMNHIIKTNKGLKPFQWQYCYKDYQLMSKVLSAHFRNTWLSRKLKSYDQDRSGSAKFKSSNKVDCLETIPEDLESPEAPGEFSNNSSLQTEWAGQKLPIPVHWFLSPISCTSTRGHVGSCSSGDFVDIAKSGLFLLFGLEAFSYLINIEHLYSPVEFAPLIWKLHALSMALLVRTDRMDVLEDDKSKDIYENLQILYGLQIDQLRHRADTDIPNKYWNGAISSESSLLLKSKTYDNIAFLNFQSELHENYTTFLENLVEQFGAISYGNVLYGRQIAIYLHRSVEVVIRLAAWNSLTNTHVLELLPSLDDCIAEPEGYLEPMEDNKEILEAYSKSWASGALDKAAARGSMSFTLALHHLSCFIFFSNLSQTIAFRNKLVKSLLRDYSRKPQHQGMLCSLIRYRRPKFRDDSTSEDAHLQEMENKRRWDIMSTACEGNSSLLGELAKLKLS